MLVELAIGDAYGAGFEYSPRSMIRQRNDLSGYVQHPRHGIRPGCYTDDTQMSIAVAESMVSGEPWTRELLADRFVRCFMRDEREGYAGGFFAFLKTVDDGKEFLDRIRPFSDKSGAAMRASPIGVREDIGTVVEQCELQAALTHDTADGKCAAVAASLMTHYCLYELGPKAELPVFLSDHLSGPWLTPWSGKVGSKGMMSVRAALAVVVAHDSLSEMLKAAIDYTGDVDTVATIAMGAAACSQEVEHDLPDHLFEQLENGPYGLGFLRELDRALLALKGR